jgi:hypothetical protein
MQLVIKNSERKAYIYWLHLPEHTDMKTEGYIGVSKTPRKRFIKHKKKTSRHLGNAFKKYGELIEQNIVWLGNEEICYELENQLRPNPQIGWNEAPGGVGANLLTVASKGGKANKGKPKTAEHRQNISKGKMGNIGRLGIPHTEEAKQKMRKPKPLGFGEKLSKAKKGGSNGQLGKKRGPYKRKVK